MVVTVGTLMLFLSALVGGEKKEMHNPMYYPKLQSYIDASMERFNQIPEERREQLKKLAHYIESHVKADQDANLIFICTHNSRRSHMSQIWARTAAAFYGIPRVRTFSGGTEATAFNPRAVAALRRAGFEVKKTTENENPIYHVRNRAGAEPMQAFSKVFNQAPNPQRDFCAVMTCSDADQNCPFVPGASARVAIPYNDPKAHDGTDGEVAAYDERCRQISIEMFYLFSQVNVGEDQGKGDND
jgi:protein-tyrosine phosphatase/arsenate reductase